jgi:hypothetical protein
MNSQEGKNAGKKSFFSRRTMLPVLEDDQINKIWFRNEAVGDDLVIFDEYKIY